MHKISDHTTNVNAAIEYAAQGIPVFPCASKNTWIGRTEIKAKRPFTTHGFKDATTDENQIRAWWRTWPDAAIGMPTGAVSGVIVLDADVYKPEGAASFEAVKQKHGIPKTLTAKTGSGGLQFFFKHPGIRIKNAAGKPGPGIDIRGDGGYVILPPSRNETGRYAWINDLEPAEMPDWLKEALLGNGESPKAEPNPIVDAFDEFFGGIPGNEGYAEKALNEECAGLAAMPPNSGRNSALNAKAYRLGRFIAAGHLSREVVERRLYEAACACGLDKDDNCGEDGIWKTIASGIESGMQRPLEKQIDATEDEHGLTDDALALQLGAESWNENARFVNTWNRWFFWNGTFWEPDETRMHERQCREFLRKKAGKLKELAAKTEDEKEARQLIKAANMLRSEAVCRRVLTMARSNPASMANTNMWDWCPDIIGTPAGVIDLRTGNAKPAVREDYITRVTAVAPSAGEPKRWIAFLMWAMRGDADMVAFLQRFLGYVLTGHVSEHVFAFLFGGGNNGKSTVINTVMAILGKLARKLPAETILASKNERHPTDLAGLVGARLAVCSEVPHGRQWNEAMIKDMTGGDVITARLMRQDYFDFRPQFKLMIAGNHQPGLASVDVAIRRRMLMIPFEAQVEPGCEDKRLGAKLTEESGAILNWMIQGAVEWYQDGLRPPEKVLCATDAYLEAEDELKRFIDETLEADQEAVVPTRDLYDKYVAWATASGIRNPMPHKALTRALRERGLEVKVVKHNGAAVRALPGYRLKK